VTQAKKDHKSKVSSSVYGVEAAGQGIGLSHCGKLAGVLGHPQKPVNTVKRFLDGKDKGHRGCDGVAIGEGKVCCTPQQHAHTTRWGEQGIDFSQAAGEALAKDDDAEVVGCCNVEAECGSGHGALR
jgi:hypothetical protein